MEMEGQRQGQKSTTGMRAGTQNELTGGTFGGEMAIIFRTSVGLQKGITMTVPLEWEQGGEINRPTKTQVTSPIKGGVQMVNSEKHRPENPTPQKVRTSQKTT